MSNPNVFTQTGFAQYAKGLLATHSVSFTDEEGDVTKYEKGGSHTALARTVFDVETGALSIIDGEQHLGSIFLSNEYSDRHKQAVTEIYNYTKGAEGFVPIDEG